MIENDKIRFLSLWVWSPSNCYLLRFLWIFNWGSYYIAFKLIQIYWCSFYHLSVSQLRQFIALVSSISTVYIAFICIKGVDWKERQELGKSSRFSDLKADFIWLNEWTIIIIMYFPFRLLLLLLLFWIQYSSGFFLRFNNRNR